MRFFIYYRPMQSVRGDAYLGDLIHISEEQKEYSPDGEVWKSKRCFRSDKAYVRLMGMLENGGMGGDGILPLSEKRSVSDLIKYMNSWGYNESRQA